MFIANKGIYGYRRILLVLCNKGYLINHKTVLKLMNILRLKGKQYKNTRYHLYKREIGKVVGNLLKRDFHSENSFEKLKTDVTEFKFCGEKVYLSPIMDLFNREIVSYSVSKCPNLDQIREMLNGYLKS